MRASFFDALRCERTGRPRAPRRTARFLLAVLAFVALLAPASADRTGGPPPQAPASVGTAVTGLLSVVWGDPGPGSRRPPQVEFTISADDGREWLLDVSAVPDRDRLVRLDRRRVRAVVRADAAPAGAAAVAPAQVPRLGVSSVEAESAPRGQAAGGEAAVVGNKAWISVPCRFADTLAEPNSLAYFQAQYSTTYPGLAHYWREVSYDIANIDGSTAIDWVTLPQPRSYYVYDTNGDGQVDFDFTRATNDCVAAGDAAIDYSAYAGVNLLFNGELDGSSWGGSRYLTLDGSTRSWMMTWLPPWGYENHGVFAHEMGHGFGLPHSSGTYGQTYDNAWDVMSDTWSGCNRPGGRDATYGCLPQHAISAYKDLLGWILPARKTTLGYGGQATVTLERLAQPTNTNTLLLQSPSVGSVHFTVEARRRVGYDAYLPGDAVIIHRVDETSGRAYVMDADTGNTNTADAGAMWVVGETFADAATSLTVTVDGASSTGFTVTMRHGAPVRTLTVVKSGAGTGAVTSTPAGISCGSTCTASLPADVAVQLAASPASNSYFADWGGDCSASGAVTLTADRSCTARFELLTLPRALDTAYLPWSTSGDVPWFPQSAVSHDGVDAAQSGAIGPGQTSSLQRTFAGPGTLVFYWRIDSTYGTLSLYRNNVAVSSVTVSSSSGWIRWSIGLPSGTQTLRWTFTKTANAPSGADAGWVDEVSGPAPTFTDDPLQARATVVKAVHVSELRVQVGQLRTRYGLGAVTWSDPSLAARVTQVRAAHLSELRAALNPVFAAATLTPPTYSPSSIVARQTVITAAQIAEIRAAILMLW